MSLLDKLFSKKKPVYSNETSTWEEILDYLYDYGLEWFDDDLIKLIYSKDRSRRFLILRSKSGIFKIALQQVLMDRYPDPYDPYPAHWEFVAGWDLRSFYDSEEDAFKNIIQSSEYQTYFMPNE